MLARTDPEACGLPAAWGGAIVDEVTAALGDVPILLAGSRAVGTAAPDSDCDVTVVVALARAPLAAARLGAVSARLSERLGVAVSANPLPAHQLTSARPGLYVAKLHAEARVLSAPRGFTLQRRAPGRVSPFAAASYALCAALGVLEAIDPAATGSACLEAPLARAIRRAVLHVAQLRLLDRGAYASTLADALAAVDDDALGAVVRTTDRTEALALVRDLLLAELRDRPLVVPWWRAPARNCQYAGIAAVRGRARWRAVASWTSADVALAGAIAALLRATALDAVVRGELDAPASCRRLATRAACGHERTWTALRARVAIEWRDAHPLGGLVR